MNAYLILGCNSHTDTEGFRYSEGLSNPIVDLSRLGKDKSKEVLDFLDNACGLFDAPMFNYNKCINTMSFLHKTFGIINENTLHKIQIFIRMHKRGGIYLMLILKEDYNG